MVPKLPNPVVAGFAAVVPPRLKPVDGVVEKRFEVAGAPKVGWFVVAPPNILVVPTPNPDVLGAPKVEPNADGCC